MMSFAAEFMRGLRKGRGGMVWVMWKVFGEVEKSRNFQVGLVLLSGEGFPTLEIQGKVWNRKRQSSHQEDPRQRHGRQHAEQQHKAGLSQPFSTDDRRATPPAAVDSRQ